MCVTAAVADVYGFENYPGEGKRRLFSVNAQSLSTWIIGLVSIALVLIRPKGWPEAIWAIAGAALQQRVQEAVAKADGALMSSQVELDGPDAKNGFVGPLNKRGLPQRHQ